MKDASKIIWSSLHRFLLSFRCVLTFHYVCGVETVCAALLSEIYPFLRSNHRCWYEAVLSFEDSFYFLLHLSCEWFIVHFLQSQLSWNGKKNKNKKPLFVLFVKSSVIFIFVDVAWVCPNCPSPQQCAVIPNWPLAQVAHSSSGPLVQGIRTTQSCCAFTWSHCWAVPKGWSVF